MDSIISDLPDRTIDFANTIQNVGWEVNAPQENIIVSNVIAKSRNASAFGMGGGATHEYSNGHAIVKYERDRFRCNKNIIFQNCTAITESNRSITLWDGRPERKDSNQQLEMTSDILFDGCTFYSKQTEQDGRIISIMNAENNEDTRLGNICFKNICFHDCIFKKLDNDNKNKNEQFVICDTEDISFDGCIFENYDVDTRLFKILNNNKIQFNSNQSLQVLRRNFL